MKKSIGLTLGKFAPLHKGHQLLIDSALAENDHVIVIIYNCPDTIKCPLHIRSQWIREIYPQVEVIEAWDGPLEVSNDSEIKKKHEDYILKVLSGKKIARFYSSEFYGDHVSKALGAIDRRIDESRENYSISGTKIRRNLYKHKEFLHPRVYRDLISNVVFLGAPSTGKTTICEELAKEYFTAWMPEYGREYWDAYQIDRRLSLQQLVEISEGHIEREEKLLLEANKYLFTDTNAITTYMFSIYYHRKAHEKLKEYANKCISRYDINFVCDTDIPYDDTWDRSGSANRLVFQKQIIADLQGRKIPFFLLSGSIEERMEYVKGILRYHYKYQNNISLIQSLKDHNFSI